MDDFMSIDWLSSTNKILFNPRMARSEKDRLLDAIPLIDHLEGHFCLATSGSSGQLKWVVLSKSAILSSAHAVNLHLESDKSDIWLNPLPDFHVGGLGVLARGYLSKARVVSCNFPSRWCPNFFLTQLKNSQATLTSLVPTQVFDLVSSGFKAPDCLRAIIVGGGAMNEKLYFAALNLGWKILPSYGLTECASQVATATYGSWSALDYPLLKPLTHVRLALESGYLKIHSEALLTAYLRDENGEFKFYDPKNEGWFLTEDRPLFEGQLIKSVHRGEDFVKIGGESVDLLRLQNILDEEMLALKVKADMVLIPLIDERLGHCLHLVMDSPLSENVNTLLDHYHKRVFPFERVCKIHYVKEIPRSSLKKVLRVELESLLA